VMTNGPTLFWLFVGVICLAALVVVVVEGPQRLARGSLPAELPSAAPAR